MLILLWLFSPIVDSLRGLQQVSELDRVLRKLGIGRASLGSLSESVSVFDSQRLKQIAVELSYQLPQQNSRGFGQIDQTLTAVGGSVIKTVVTVARLAWLPQSQGKTQSAYRLHTYFEMLRGVPRQGVRGWTDQREGNPGDCGLRLWLCM